MQPPQGGAPLLHPSMLRVSSGRRRFALALQSQEGPPDELASRAHHPGTHRPCPPFRVPVSSPLQSHWQSQPLSGAPDALPKGLLSGFPQEWQNTQLSEALPSSGQGRSWSRCSWLGKAHGKQGLSQERPGEWKEPGAP